MGIGTLVLVGIVISRRRVARSTVSKILTALICGAGNASQHVQSMLMRLRLQRNQATETRRYFLYKLYHVEQIVGQSDTQCFSMLSA